MLGWMLEREVGDAAARLADAGRCRVPPEAWEPFGQVVRDIVGLTLGEEVAAG